MPAMTGVARERAYMTPLPALVRYEQPKRERELFIDVVGVGGCCVGGKDGDQLVPCAPQVDCAY
jgi:hypothetical protein